MSDEVNASFDYSQTKLDLDIVTLILKAAILLNKPDELQPFRAAIEEPAANYKDHQEQYWANRARLALLDKHPQDALAYYRLALDNRTTEPEYHQGILHDDVTPEFHALWVAQGGTETAWNLWNAPAPEPAPAKTEATTPEKNEAKPATPSKAKSKPSALKKPATTEWQVMDKQLPAFELSDFNGKLWRQKDLQGKVVVITTWATWCGWCILQDHSLQKLYEQTKDRKDLVILTMNIDENSGLVRPFMQRQKYTFPVLAAVSYAPVNNIAIPRTWIIDPKGKWRWMKDGFDDQMSYAEFEKDMLHQIELAKSTH